MSTDVHQGRLRRRDTAFLIVVAVLSLFATGLSFYVGQHQKSAVTATADDDDEPHVSLPAGPRKYQ
jgi:hypothetical protein